MDASFTDPLAWMMELPKLFEAMLADPLASTTESLKELETSSMSSFPLSTTVSMKVLDANFPSPLAVTVGVPSEPVVFDAELPTFIVYPTNLHEAKLVAPLTCMKVWSNELRLNLVFPSEKILEL